MRHQQHTCGPRLTQLCPAQVVRMKSWITLGQRASGCHLCSRHAMRCVITLDWMLVPYGIIGAIVIFNTCLCRH